MHNDQTSAGSGLSISSGYYTRNESGKEPILSYVAGGPSVGKVTLDGAKLQIVTGKFLID